MRILYLDHALHKRTGSTRFVADFLAGLGELTEYSIENVAYDLDDPLFETECDVAVVFQLERWALGFLNRGVPTVIMPMFDQSGRLPEAYWRIFNGADFVNFSKTLHEAVSDQGNRSRHIQYFKPESDGFPHKERRARSAFFWQRTPLKLNAIQVAAMLEGGIDHLHIHQAHDPGQPEGPGAAEIEARWPRLGVSESNWFDSADELRALASSHQIYVAPRLQEGIGMGFLEAMSRGQTVIAHDRPTHSEYIRHGRNGLLWRSGDRIDLSLYDLDAIGERAAADSAAGRSLYLSHRDVMADAIRKAQPSRRAGTIGSPAFETLLKTFTIKGQPRRPAIEAYLKEQSRYLSS